MSHETDSLWQALSRLSAQNDDLRRRVALLEERVSAFDEISWANADEAYCDITIVEED